MNLLSVSNLSKIGREKPLFTEVTFGIQEGEKAALIGKNGTGKSTLLNTIAGILVPDEGSVVINKEAGVSFLPQNPLFDKEDTIRNHIFKSSSPKLAIIKEYLEVCDELGKNDKAQKRYDLLLEKMDLQDLWNYESQISSILSTLGITDLNRKMGTLSGGMIKKVALAQVLVEDTKLLLLDEPTNHLDITTITWLQNYLHETKRSILMVTHDRYFLDAVCNNIYELARNKIKLYQGNYSQYLEKKETEAEIEQNTERRIESVLRFERQWLLRGPCARGTKIKARIQRDEQLINREKFQADKGFTLEVKGKRLGGKVLELHNISKNFPKGFVNEGQTKTIPVINNFSYKFTKGEKIGIFGDNGSGKSTLLNIITQTIQPDSGIIDVGINTSFAYYTQNPVIKDTSMPVLEYIKETAEHITMNDGKVLSASRFLEEFGFEGKIQYSPVSTLSGGELKRLYLVKLLLTNPNFLILDEPTNDFDIFTMNILEDFLINYKGCLLIVSHDRYFMDKVADTLFILEDNGDVSGFVGKCSEYIEYREELKAQKEEERAKKSVERQSSTSSKSSTKTKLTFNEQKEFETLDKEIPELEEKKSLLEEKMSTTDYEELQKITEEYKAISTELEQKYERWEKLAEFV
ncbi:MAG: ABC-F family ATP-binding cassette domain-containing protein [Treponema bryantii]|nr:ABC-F family ATP-binding cassette domain-containing protein [Treponema bryantii]